MTVFHRVEAFFQLQHATNWIQFQQALKLFIGPSQNFIYADKEGNIGIAPNE
jgi:penicillin amidase